MFTHCCHSSLPLTITTHHYHLPMTFILPVMFTLHIHLLLPTVNITHYYQTLCSLTTATHYYQIFNDTQYVHFPHPFMTTTCPYYSSFQSSCSPNYSNYQYHLFMNSLLAVMFIHHYNLSMTLIIITAKHNHYLLMILIINGSYYHSSCHLSVTS